MTSRPFDCSKQSPLAASFGHACSDEVEAEAAHDGDHDAEEGGQAPEALAEPEDLNFEFTG